MTESGFHPQQEVLAQALARAHTHRANDALSILTPYNNGRLSAGTGAEQADINTEMALIHADQARIESERRERAERLCASDLLPLARRLVFDDSDDEN